ncbi:helix-turn-helix transcriptional regulator [Neobacillus novalis]|uniref:Helix-turn-helix transcriptional regulator n=1 Tax=Neobacillus novalis TaxID=220687 RepID=A0AA95MM99_9BACI|nr:helix-turn-helix transcriptional regulator [Neobacillus novalis]WHY86311.1 helix-turn-helix transcriptional regulator [Neobacillus novalis]
MEKSFGEVLKEARIYKNWSIKELATLSRVNESLIARLENGTNRNPTILTMQKLANTLEIDIQELVKFHIEDEQENLNKLTYSVSLNLLLPTNYVKAHLEINVEAQNDGILRHIIGHMASYPEHHIEKMDFVPLDDGDKTFVKKYRQAYDYLRILLENDLTRTEEKDGLNIVVIKKVPNLAPLYDTNDVVGIFSHKWKTAKGGNHALLSLLAKKGLTVELSITDLTGLVRYQFKSLSCKTSF